MVADEAKSELDRKYDVVLSFAGEDREYVKAVANYLAKRDINCFYDEYDESDLWGKDLYVHLDEIYRLKSKYCIMFLSENYAKKSWTNHERKSAQARAFNQFQEYILPVKLDNTEIPGIIPTTGYLNGVLKTPEEIGALFIKKLTNHIEPVSFDNSDSIQFEAHGLLKRVYSNKEKLSSIVTDALLFSKKIMHNELNRFCTVELMGIKKGESYPDFFHRKIDMYVSFGEINTAYFGWNNNLENAYAFMENNPDKFTYTKIFVWQPLNELEDMINNENLKHTLVTFNMTPADLNVKVSDPSIKLKFYAKTSKYKDVVIKIRNRFTEILLEIIDK